MLIIKRIWHPQKVSRSLQIIRNCEQRLLRLGDMLKLLSLAAIARKKAN